MKLLIDHFNGGLTEKIRGDVKSIQKCGIRKAGFDNKINT